VTPTARDRSLAIARRRCRLRYMVEWSEDHVAAIGTLNSNTGLIGGILVKPEIGRGP
jgi:hypothetical protein